MNRPALWMLGLSALLLTGCALGPHRDQLQLWTLDPMAAPAAPDSAPAPLSWQLLIEEPLADPVLADARIVRRSAAGLGVYRGVAWSDRATPMWQRLLVQSFQNDGRLPGVARSSARVHGDVLLLSELRAFQVEDDAQVVVQVQAQLIRTDRQQVFATRSFRTVVPLAGGEGALAMAAAFQRAVDVLLPQIVDWTLEQGLQALPSQR